MLRCTIFDAAGTAKSSSGVFKKSKLCTDHGLEPRDLRKIDSRVPNLVPTILARKDGILVNILHIRAMIKADMVLLFDSYGSSDTHLHSAFVYNLQFNLRQGSSSLPYEFRALESILVSVLDALRIELDLIRTWAGRLLQALDEDVDREKLRALLQVSRKLNSFLSRSRAVKGAVTEVLENDEDMALMYLTDSKEGQARTEESKMDELELLLESFDKQVEEVVAETEQIHNDMTNTQEVVELILDTNRNRLLALDLKTSMATLGISAGTLWAGLFGMNLTSHFEEHEYAFFVSSGVAFATALIVGAYGFRHLERLRRVGLQLRDPFVVNKGLAQPTVYRSSKYGGASDKYPPVPAGKKKRRWFWPFPSSSSAVPSSKSSLLDMPFGSPAQATVGPYTWTDEKYNQALAQRISDVKSQPQPIATEQSFHTSKSTSSSSSYDADTAYHERRGPLYEAPRGEQTASSAEEQQQHEQGATGLGLGLGGKWDSRRRRQT